MKRKDYWNMSVDELAQATKGYDQEGAMDESAPLRAEDAERWRRARKKRGRPQVGKGSQRISVSIERSLLLRVNSFAKRKKLSRSKLLAKVLQDALDDERKRITRV
jgi:hypothetical protein